MIGSVLLAVKLVNTVPFVPFVANLASKSSRINLDFPLQRPMASGGDKEVDTE